MGSGFKIFYALLLLLFISLSPITFSGTYLVTFLLTFTNVDRERMSEKTSGFNLHATTPRFWSLLHTDPSYIYGRAKLFDKPVVIVFTNNQTTNLPTVTKQVAPFPPSVIFPILEPSQSCPQFQNFHSEDFYFLVWLFIYSCIFLLQSPSFSSVD